MRVTGLIAVLVGLTIATKIAHDLPFRPSLSIELDRRQSRPPKGISGAAKPPTDFNKPGRNRDSKNKPQLDNLQNPTNTRQGGACNIQNNQVLLKQSIQCTGNGLDDDGADQNTAAARVSQDNFINDCKNKKLCNGLQNDEQCCNPVIMGDIPAPENMPTVSILSPRVCDNVRPEQGITVAALYTNIILGSFTNPASTYNANPQQVDKATGLMIGHTHFTCHLMNGAKFNTESPVTASQFLKARADAKNPQKKNQPRKACFKGFDGQGERRNDGTILVKQDLECGGPLAEGCWTCNTMTGASTHQAAVMGKADRPAQDTATFFSVSKDPKTNNCGCIRAGNSAKTSTGRNRL